MQTILKTVACLILALAEGMTGANVCQVDFPISDYGKTEYNQSVFETAFSVSIELPEDWYIEQQSDGNDAVVAGLFSPATIFAGDGTPVGSIGYCTFDLEQYGIESPYDNDLEPMMIYNEIALGNHHSFTVARQYDLVSTLNNTDTALTRVMVDRRSIKEVDMDEYNYGIVSCNFDISAYVAIEIYLGACDESTVKDIALSVKFLTAKTTSEDK
jgi:hypothetical protein